MRLILTAISLLFIIELGCKSTSHTEKAAYQWLSYEIVPRDSLGNINGITEWHNAHRMPLPGDTFFFYQNNDSIQIKFPKITRLTTLKKTNIRSKVWKPVPQYGDRLFFVNTYTNDSLPGLYLSVYTTKDRTSLMEVFYTNPGNLTDVLFFSKDSVNILQANGIIIDPKDEATEPEQAQVK